MVGRGHEKVGIYDENIEYGVKRRDSTCQSSNVVGNHGKMEGISLERTTSYVNRGDTRF